MHANELTIKTEICVVVFDFGGVIARVNTTHMADFLITSIKINKDELSDALRAMQGFVSNGGSEKEFWEQYAASKEVILPSDWLDQFTTVIKESITEMPGTLAIVKALQNQGYQTAMLSDVTQHQAEIIRKMGYYDLFHPALLSYAIEVQKPHPEAFKILLNQLQLNPSHILFIDDRNENVEAAKNLGINSLQFISPQQLEEDLEKKGIHLNKITKVEEDIPIILK